MASTDHSPPFYERRWFQGAVAVVGLAAAIWALVGAPKPWQVAADLSSTKLPLSDTEIVLDASSAMAGRFGDGTKLDAAARAVGQYVVPFNNEGLALRRAGGGCSEPGELLVDFGDDHSDDVSEAAAEQRPAGRSNVAYAVRAAVDDFTAERFHGSQSSKRILIFMGGEDECAEDATEEIRDELDRSGISAVFRVVALKVSGKALKRLKDFEKELAPYADVEIRTPDTEGQLEEVIEEEEEEVAAVDAGESEAAGGEAEEPEPEEENSSGEESEEESGEEGSGEGGSGEEVTPEEESPPEEEPEKPAEEEAPEQESSEESSPEPEAGATSSRTAGRPDYAMLARFVELYFAAHLDPAVGEGSAEQDGAVALVDGDWAGKLGA